MSTGAVVAGVIVVVVVVIVVLAVCGYFVYKYFWKDKNKKEGEGGGKKDVENANGTKHHSTKVNTKLNANGTHNGSSRSDHNRSAGKPPGLNLAQVNLAFDRAYDPQASYEPEVPNSANSSLSNNEWPNKSYSYDQSQSESAGTSDSEYGAHHLSSSTEHSRKSIRFADHLPTVRGDQPPDDGRSKIERAKVTLIPPPAPRGKMPLPVISVNKSQLKRMGSGRGGHPRISMDPMPAGKKVSRKHSTGSRSASLDNSHRGTSPHRRSGSGRRTSSRSPHRNSGRRSRSNDSANRHHNDSSSGRGPASKNEDRYSGSSFDSNLSVEVFNPAPDAAQNTHNAPPSKQNSLDYSMGMHPGMSGEAASKAPKSSSSSQPFTHLVAGSSGIQTQNNTPAESQNFDRNTQQRRSRSRKRRPRNKDDSDTSITRDIVSGTGPVGDVDSPPTMQMVPPGNNQSKPKQSHASPLAQSSPQAQRNKKMQQQNNNSLHGSGQLLYDGYSGDVRPHMPYDYYPPGSPGDALNPGKNNNKSSRDNSAPPYQPESYRQGTQRSRSATTPRSPLYGDKISDPDSNYFSGSSGDRLDSETSSPRHAAAPGGPLVFEGVANPAFENNESGPYTAAPTQQNKPTKKRRRKSQNRGKNTAGSQGGGQSVNNSGSAYNNNSVQNVQPSVGFRQPVGGAMHEFSNDSLIYMDFGTDTDIYAISSKKAAKTKQSGVALGGGKSGETEL